MIDPIPSLSPAPTPIERIVRPFQRFTATESAGGIVLLAATALALVWANSPWAESYFHLWELPVRIGVGSWQLTLSLHHLVNDGLMAVFFFLVGLEIKREMLVGELASLRAATLPIAGALGGMVVPAILYALVNAGGPGAAGWGIPMATDIAFAIGVLALVGGSVPVGLKVFLTALAIADDLGAVLVIALFYTSELRMGPLATAALALLGLLALNALGVRGPGRYALLGAVLWLALLYSGVHATVAGVLAAMAVPARTRIDSAEFLLSGRALLQRFDDAGEEGAEVLTNEGQQSAVLKLEDACEKVQAPLLRIEHGLQPWVSFGIIPVFALANAGVALDVDPARALADPVTAGVILGLVIGKPLGITLLSWLAVRLGYASLPLGVRWDALHAVSWLGGIGFTMSLFVAGLAFGERSPLLGSAKLGILAASALAALGGWLLLRRSRRRTEASRTAERSPAPGGGALHEPTGASGD